MRLFVIAAFILFAVCQPLTAETTKPSSGKYPKEINDLIIKAEQGDISAQLFLGLKYIKGDGVIKDYKEAFKWYRKAAEHGHVLAQYNLGLMYANGYGTIEDNKEAARWYRKAAEQGYARAQCALGVMYEFGYGVIENDKEAASWYRKAAEQGNASAQKNLGVMYDFGYGVMKDRKEAIKWYRNAAEQGHAAAQYNLSVLKAMSTRDLKIYLIIFGHFLCGIICTGIICFHNKLRSRSNFFCIMGFGILFGYLSLLATMTSIVKCCGERK